MTEFRSRILQSKQNESSLIASSRKRKLRELYAVADCDGPIPHSWVIVDAEPPPPPPPPSAAESLFLEHNDILQRRIFDESSLPNRRQLRSQTVKVVPSTRKGLDGQTPDGSRLLPKSPHNVGTRKSRGGTPVKELVTGLNHASANNLDTSRRGRSVARVVDAASKSPRLTASRSSQTDIAPTSEIAADSTIRDKVTAISQSPPAAELDELEFGPLEKDRIRNVVESRPSSPGVDPRKAIPFSAEDIAQLDEPLINGSHDEHHKAITAHLPPPEIQEDHLRQIDERAEEMVAREQGAAVPGNLSINLPPPHIGRAIGDPLSSPGSTIDAHSATTPALHEASTDTSPDNEGPRYYGDRSDENEADPEIPPELAPSKEEVLQKQDHDKMLKAQIDVARSDILGNTLVTADAQLRLEEEQAAAASSTEAEGVIPDSEKSSSYSGRDVSVNGSQGSQPHTGGLTGSAGEVAQDIIDDEDDEVVGVPTPEDENAPSSEPIDRPTATNDVLGEDAMDVDVSPVEDSVKNDSSQLSLVNPPSDTVQVIVDLDKSTTVHEDISFGTEAVPIPCPVSSTHTPPSPAMERMTTRVSSGAMRHKSVSEILGEIPRPSTTATSERNAVVTNLSEMLERVPEPSSHSRATTPQSPAGRTKIMLERGREKDRSKLSTVSFAKKSSDRPSKKSSTLSSSRTPDQEAGDYFLPLITSQVYNSTRGVQTLESLLLSARKTISTANAYVPFLEHQSHKILRRIHTLQSQDKWSFRQPKRSLEPNRPTSHWDELIKEAKWMRTDFREERKWKMAIAKNLARACAEWVEADEDDRVLLQVKAAIPAGDSVQTQKQDLPSSMDVNQQTPGLENSADIDSQVDDFDEEPRASLLDAVAPTAMFSLGDDDVIFSLRRSPATDKLLDELPMYGCPLKVPQSDLPTSELDPDALWRRPALPLSRYMEGKIILKDDGPPRKKSRYEYETEDDDNDQVVFGAPLLKHENLDPALLDVALFNPQNKHIRDRIHAGHQFRPPSENPMPLQSFFECRTSSQWTLAEDDELRALVREYSYNWQLISSMLSTRSLFASSAERRTPWECFERWIHLEGLPADMQKTLYFRNYNSRLEAAQKTLMAQAAQQPPQANAAGAAFTPVRRRTTTSVRVDKRRNQKHLTLVDAMRKLAKKRETSLQKQQHSAGLAAMRKANEAPQPAAPRHTPQDFSRVKHEREMAMLERVQRHQMQQEAQRRAMQQGRPGQQNPQPYPNGIPQPPRNLANPNATAPVSLPNSNRPAQFAVPGQNLPHGQVQPLPNGMAAQLPMPNGHAPIPQMPLKGIPQAQMQGIPGMPSMQGLPAQHRVPAPNPAPDLQLVLQARQISEQQRQTVQQQQQRQNTQVHNSPPNMRANINMSQQAFMQNNQAMMAAFNAGNMNGVSTTPGSGLNMPSVGPAGSPRMTHSNQAQSNGPNSQIVKLEAQVRAQFPNATPDQVNKLVRDALNQNIVSQRQSAIHAAAGGGTTLAGMPGGIQNSPQQYAQMLRAQQERQAANNQPRTASAGSGSGSGIGK